MTLYTINEVAEIMSVHRETIRRWIASGKLESVRYSERTIRIPQESLDKMKGKK